MTTEPGRRPPRLIATDLDGTLLRSDGTVSARTRRTLQRVVDRGAQLILVTGRPTRLMRPVADAVGHTGLAIAANGAVVYDLQTMRVVETFPLAGAHGAAVIEAVRQAVPDVTFAVELASEVALREAGYPHNERAGSTVASLEAMTADAVVKLIVRHPELDPDALLRDARAAAGHIAEFTHSSSIGMLEVSAAGITKASTLAIVTEQLGIDAADVVAFGDMPNDLAMLAWAGTAYGMTGAHPEVLAAVDRVAPPNDDDGVAQIIENLFNLTTEEIEP